MKREYVKFSQLKPGYNTNPRVRTHTAHRDGGTTDSYYDIIYVNCAEDELLMEGNGIFVISANDFDKSKFMLSDEE